MHLTYTSIFKPLDYSSGRDTASRGCLEKEILKNPGWDYSTCMYVRNAQKMFVRRLTLWLTFWLAWLLRTKEYGRDWTAILNSGDNVVLTSKCFPFRCIAFAFITHKKTKWMITFNFDEPYLNWLKCGVKRLRNIIIWNYFKILNGT